MLARRLAESVAVAASALSAAALVAAAMAAAAALVAAAGGAAADDPAEPLLPLPLPTLRSRNKLPARA